MIVRPDAISAKRAPSTNPLKSCDTKFAQLTTRDLAHAPRLSRRRSGVFAQVATKRVGFLHERLARHDLENLPVIFLILHVARLLAAHDDDRPHQLVVFLAEVHVTHGRWERFARLILLDDIRRIERSSLRYHARPYRQRHVSIVGAPFRLVTVLFVERLDEHLGERVLVLQRPPEICGSQDTRGELGSCFLCKEGNLVGGPRASSSARCRTALPAEWTADRKSVV